MSEITTARGALEKLLTLPNRLKERRNNRFQNKKVFEVEVISDIKFYGSDPSDPESIIFEATDGASMTRAMCKGRILDEDMSCFNFLDKPENTTIESNSVDNLRDTLLRSLHPTILFSNIENMPVDLKEGDIILARAKSGQKNIFDLQFLEFVQLKTNVEISRLTPLAPASSAFEEATEEPIPPPVKELSENVHVIYWFAGQPPEQYGADFVNQKIEELGLNERDDQLIVVGEFDDYLLNLQNEASAIVAQNGSTIIRESVGAWSGGALGLGNSLSNISTSDFDKVVLADPAPYNELTSKVSSFTSNVSMSYNLLWWQETYKDWWGGGFSEQHSALTNALSDSIHEVRYNPLVVEDSSGLNNISVEAHERILEDQLRFITNG